MNDTGKKPSLEDKNPLGKMGRKGRKGGKAQVLKREAADESAKDAPHPAVEVSQSHSIARFRVYKMAPAIVI